MSERDAFKATGQGMLLGALAVALSYFSSWLDPAESWREKFAGIVLYGAGIATALAIGRLMVYTRHQRTEDDDSHSYGGDGLGPLN